MKGVFLPAELVYLFILIIVGIGMTLVAFTAATYTKDIHRVDVTLRLYHLPLKYEDAMLAFLETTDPDTGFRMKDMLASAVNQKSSTNVYIKGKTVNFEAAAEPILSKLLEDKDFVLRASSPEVLLAGSPQKLSSQSYKVSTIFLKADGSSSNIDLYIS